jgi:hypothetical protein
VSLPHQPYEPEKTTAKREALPGCMLHRSIMCDEGMSYVAADFEQKMGMS